MADDPQPPAGLQIPADTQAKFGPLLELIKGSESMNDEERQYWINILPIMTAEQLKNLEDILSSEKQQLAAIDAKYSQQPKSERPLEQIDAEVKDKRQKRAETERQAQAAEGGTEEELLRKIQGL